MSDIKRNLILFLSFHIWREMVEYLVLCLASIFPKRFNQRGLKKERRNLYVEEVLATSSKSFSFTFFFSS